MNRKTKIKKCTLLIICYIAYISLEDSMFFIILESILVALYLYIIVTD